MSEARFESSEKVLTLWLETESRTQIVLSILTLLVLTLPSLLIAMEIIPAEWHGQTPRYAYVPACFGLLVSYMLGHHVRKIAFDREFNQFRTYSSLLFFPVRVSKRPLSDFQRVELRGFQTSLDSGGFRTHEVQFCTNDPLDYFVVTRVSKAYSYAKAITERISQFLEIPYVDHTFSQGAPEARSAAAVGTLLEDASESIPAVEKPPHFPVEQVETEQQISIRIAPQPLTLAEKLMKAIVVLFPLFVGFAVYCYWASSVWADPNEGLAFLVFCLLGCGLVFLVFCFLFLFGSSDAQSIEITSETLSFRGLVAPQSVVIAEIEELLIDERMVRDDGSSYYPDCLSVLRPGVSAVVRSRTAGYPFFRGRNSEECEYVRYLVKQAIERMASKVE